MEIWERREEGKRGNVEGKGVKERGEEKREETGKEKARKRERKRRQTNRGEREVEGSEEMQREDREKCSG